jgi:hypothetical protein
MAEIASDARPAAGREFRIGRILSRSFSIYFRHFLTFLLLGCLPALPNLVWYRGPGAATMSPAALAILFIGMLVLWPICQAMVLYGAFQDMRGRPVRLNETVAKALARFLPVVGVAICFTLAAGLATLLLIVPGFIVFTMYSVAQPVCVVERLGVFASMRRSASLTKGHRWRIFGLFLVIMVASGVFSGILLAIFSLGGVLIAQIANFVWSALFGAFFSISFVVAYHDLRVAKEGIDTDRIAAVFD